MEAQSVNKQSGGSFLLKATFVGMLLGLLAGWILNVVPMPPAALDVVVSIFDSVTAIFLRLLRMLVAPLVLSILTAGVARMGKAGSTGRVLIQALSWFAAISVTAASTSLILANVFQPGRGMDFVMPSASQGALTQPSASVDIAKVIQEIAPISLIEAMAQNHLVQIVVFAIFAGLAIGSLGSRTQALADVAEQVSVVMMRIAGYVTKAAPLAVFAALASTVSRQGLGAVFFLGGFVIEFYIVLATIALLVGLAGALYLGRRILTLIRLMREPLLVAFSTASSEACLPMTLQAIKEFGVSESIAAFILPMGYALNVIGTVAYSTFVLIFVAQCYDVQLSWTTQCGMVAFIMLISMGSGGVPRSGLIALSTALQTFHLPLAGITLILGVDAIIDMGRTVTTVFGNSVVTATVAHRVSVDRAQ